MCILFVINLHGKNIMYKIILLSLISILIASCSMEEKVVNVVEDDWKVMIAIDEASPSLQVRSMPENKIIINDIFKEKLGITLSKPVVRIREYRNNLYLFVPDEYKLYILKKIDFSKIAVLDFEADNAKPLDIAFPNATDAYISFDNANFVTLLDITNFVIAKKVNTEQNPIGIACSGNQIYVANQMSSSVSVVDSRTKNQEAVIPLPSNPAFVSITPTNGLEAVVVSIGSGKIDGTTEKSNAVATYIDIEKRNIISQVDIGVNAAKAIDQVPIGFVSTPYNWGFIATKTNLFRLDYKVRDKISSVSSKEFKYIAYSGEIDMLLLLRVNNGKTELVTASPKTGSQNKIFDIDAPAICVHSL